MYQVGQHTLSIPMSMFKENREKVVNALKASGKVSKPADTYILLQGGESLSLYDTDVDYVFRQVRYKFDYFLKLWIDCKIFIGSIFQIYDWSYRARLFSFV